MSATVGRDTRFESLFDRWHLKYKHVPSFPLAKIRRMDGAQVRDSEHRFIKELAQKYETQISNGAEFPPLVLWDPDVLIDGNHRSRAYEALGITTASVYVVEVPDIDMALIVAAALNQVNGEALTRDAARTAAVRMMNKGMADSAIARELGYTAESVRRWRRDSEFVSRIEGLGLVESAYRLTKGERNKLAGVEHTEPFAELVKLVADARPTEVDLTDIITRVKSAPSDQDALAVINEAKDDWEPIGPEPAKVIRNKAAQQARMHLGGLLKLDAEAVYEPAAAEKDVPKWEALAALASRVLDLYGARAAA
jgi:ParB-like chromosome segregation protein Spo0J